MEAGEEEILEVVAMEEEDFLEEGEMEGVVEAVVVVEGEKLNQIFN